MRPIVLSGATALVLGGLALGLPGAAQAADELKCTDRRVRGDDDGPLTLRLHKSDRPAELIFDANPIEKKGAPAARFARPGFSCTLTAAAARCTNAAKHGFVMKLPKPTLS